MLGAIAKAVFGSSNDRYVKSLDKIVQTINAFEPEMEALSDDALAAQTAKFRHQLSEGVALDAPPVRTADGEIFWRLRAEAPGDHALVVRMGEETLTKVWAVGGPHRKVPVLRTKSWEAFLYPGEAPLGRSSAARSISLAYPERELPLLPGGELGILATFFALSLVAGFALKGRFGVTL